MIRTFPKIKLVTNFNFRIRNDEGIACRIFSEVMDPRISAVCKFWDQCNSCDQTNSLILEKYKHQPLMIRFTACFPLELMQENPTQAVQWIFHGVHGLLKISGLKQEASKLQRTPLDLNPLMQMIIAWNGYSTLPLNTQAAIVSNLFNEDGFVKDPSRDSNHSIEDGQTVSEIQGSTAFCKKVVHYTKNDPGVLSPNRLRINHGFNKNYLILKWKRIGHAFNLKGKIVLPDNTFMNLTGGSETFFLPMLRDMFNQFASVCKISPTLLNSMNESLSKAMWHDNATEEKIEEIHQLIHDPNYRSPILIGSGHVWHSTWTIIWKERIGDEDQFRLGYCNRGQDHQGKPGIVLLKVGNPSNITPHFLKRLARRLNVSHARYLSLERIKSNLSAVEEAYIFMKEQKVGNCIYTSLKAAFFGLLVLFDIDRSQAIYKVFTQFDAESILADFLIDLENIDLNKCGLEDYDNYILGLKAIAQRLRRWLVNKRMQYTPFKKVNNEAAKEALRAISAFEAKVGPLEDAFQHEVYGSPHSKICINEEENIDVFGVIEFSL